MALPSNAHLILHFFVGYCRHDYPPSPTMWNFIDFGVVNGVTGLFAWPTAAFPYPPARKPDRGGILAMGLPLEGSGTDATLMVPHVPVPLMASAMLPLLILLGSSKIVMASSRTRIWCKGLLGVTGEMEQAVGCCIIPHFPVSLNMQCWDFKGKCKSGDVSIGAPVLSDIVIAPNTVQVGVGLDDYLTVIMDWAIDVVLAVVMAYGPKLKKSKPPKALSGKALARATRAGDKAADKALKKGLAKGMKKEAAEASAAAARKAAYDHAGKSLTKIYAKAGAKVAFKVLKNTEWYRNAQDVDLTTDEVKHQL